MDCQPVSPGSYNDGSGTKHCPPGTSAGAQSDPGLRYFSLEGQISGSTTTQGAVLHNFADPPTVESGQNVGGLVFDGTDDYVELPLWELGDTFSVEAFVLFSSFNGLNTRVFDFNKRAAVGEGHLYLSEYGAGGDGAARFTQGMTVADFWELGKWAHVVATIDSAGIRRLFRDGVLLGEAPCCFVAAPHTHIDVGLNWRGPDTADYFKGTMRFLAFYDRLLVIDGASPTAYRIGLAGAIAISACESCAGNSSLAGVPRVGACLTASPTLLPTVAPTYLPSSAPTSIPTDAPTDAPTLNPTLSPTLNPTTYPTTTPTGSPTTAVPTASPTVAPTGSPTTAAPTVSPTASPTFSYRLLPEQGTIMVNAEATIPSITVEHLDFSNPTAENSDGSRSALTVRIVSMPSWIELSEHFSFLIRAESSTRLLGVVHSGRGEPGLNEGVLILSIGWGANAREVHYPVTAVFTRPYAVLASPTSNLVKLRVGETAEANFALWNIRTLTFDYVVSTVHEGGANRYLGSAVDEHASFTGSLTPVSTTQSVKYFTLVVNASGPTSLNRTATSTNIDEANSSTDAPLRALVTVTTTAGESAVLIVARQIACIFVH